MRTKLEEYYTEIRERRYWKGAVKSVVACSLLVLCFLIILPEQ
jgi:hypothetical protein